MFRFWSEVFSLCASDFLLPNSLYKSSNVYFNLKPVSMGRGISALVTIEVFSSERYSLISFVIGQITDRR